MFGFNGEGARPSSLLATTVKSALVIAGLSYVAAHWLSASSLDQDAMGRLAGTIGRGLDPTMTGSIGSKGDIPRLDPCRLNSAR